MKRRVFNYMTPSSRRTSSRRWRPWASSAVAAHAPADHGARSLYFMLPPMSFVPTGEKKSLDELLIVGNSFLSYAKRRIGDDLHPGIREALPLLREVRLDLGLAGVRAGAAFWGGGHEVFDDGA